MAKDRLKRALADIAVARATLSRARREIARFTKPGAPGALVEPRWVWAERVLRLRKRQLLAIDGVVGCGMGYRIVEKERRRTSEPCITVLVRNKISRNVLKARRLKIAPRWVREGRRRLPIDVVEFGRLKRQSVRAGDSVGPASGPRRKGTLGAFALELESAATIVALTAMHVVPDIEEYPDGKRSPVAFSVPSQLDAPGAGVFGSLKQGTLRGVDAAKILPLLPQTLQNDIPSIGEVRGWRPLVYPNDKATVVRMYGTVSHFQTGSIVAPRIDLPEEDLQDAILVDIESEDGDSGAALIDPENLLLGFLVGVETGRHGLRVFCPASLVLGRLGCDIPTR